MILGLRLMDLRNRFLKRWMGIEDGVTGRGGKNIRAPNLTFRGY